MINLQYPQTQNQSRLKKITALWVFLSFFFFFFAPFPSDNNNKIIKKICTKTKTKKKKNKKNIFELRKDDEIKIWYRIGGEI